VQVTGFQHLAEGGLRTFAALWQAAEAACMPAQVARLLIIGLPKKGGMGVRPIGAYGAFLRVGLKARRGAFREVDAALGRIFFSAAQGVAAGDVAWRHACEGEAAGAEAGHFALVAWDLTSMYDMLGLRRLARKAAELGIPTVHPAGRHHCDARLPG